MSKKYSFQRRVSKQGLSGPAVTCYAVTKVMKTSSSLTSGQLISEDGHKTEARTRRLLSHGFSVHRYFTAALGAQNTHLRRLKAYQIKVYEYETEALCRSGPVPNPILLKLCSKINLEAAGLTSGLVMPNGRLTCSTGAFQEILYL